MAKPQMWARTRALNVHDDDFPRAQELWARGDARVVGCGPQAIDVTGLSCGDAGSWGASDQAARDAGVMTGVRLRWRQAEGPFRADRCWLLDAGRAWFASPVPVDGSGGGEVAPVPAAKLAGLRAAEPAPSPGSASTSAAGSASGSAANLTSLRAAWPLLGDDEAQAAVAAAALAAWHADFGFCPRCGRPTTVQPGGWVRQCAVCEAPVFPRIDPAIIVALIDDRDRLLLGAQQTWGKRRSVFAGFVMAGESLEQAVHREIAEEVGLRVDHVRYFGSQPWPFPRSLMVAFTAHVKNPEAMRVDGEEIVEADWFTRQEVQKARSDGEIDLPQEISVANRLIETWLQGS